MAEEQQPPKKDLTSLIELSAIELAKNPHLGDPHGGDPNLQVTIEKVSEADFGDLEELSKQAAAAEAAAPPPAPEPTSATSEAPPAPDLSAAPALDIGAEPQMAALETAPGEAPSGAINAIPGAEAAVPTLDPNAPPESFELPSHSQMSDQSAMAPGELVPGLEGLPGADAMAPLDMMPPPDAGTAQTSGTGTGPQFAINEGPPSTPQPIPPMADTSAAIGSADQTAQLVPTGQMSAPAATAEAPAPTPKTTLDPNRPPVKAPPAGSSHAVKGKEPAAGKQDLSDVKKFADRLAIGRPKIEGAPAFSLLARNANGYFDEKTIKAIELAVTSEDFGIRMEDVSIQLSSGKMLVPQISEFAAVTLAQKLRDVVDIIEVDLATEIFKSSAAELSSVDDSVLLDTEEFETHHEEIHDMGAEPRTEDDLFSTNLPEVSDFQVTRILSVVMASEIVHAEIAENPSGKEFENATEKLTRELIARAFKLGAHGVLGINFTLRTIDAYKDPTGKVRRAYRLLGTGTAVRVRKKSQ